SGLSSARRKATQHHMVFGSMKRLVAIALLIISISEACSGASIPASSQRVPPRTGGSRLYWTSSTIATSAAAARATIPATDAAMPATDAVALSSSRRMAFSRVLRGGGGSNSDGGGSEMEEKTSPPQKQDVAVEPASSSQPGGDPTKGAVGEGPETDSATVKPAAAAAAAAAAVKQEPKGDAKEQALREALLSADGPSK
ncbi:unnamed protein product, partial [Ectocarpus sp. 12 AP-2014]